MNTAQDKAPLPVLHNLILAEVFHAKPEALTVTEIFRRTTPKITASGLLDFSRAVVRLADEKLLEPVNSTEFHEGHPGRMGRIIKTAISSKGEMYLLSLLICG